MRVAILRPSDDDAEASITVGITTRTQNTRSVTSPISRTVIETEAGVGVAEAHVHDLVSRPGPAAALALDSLERVQLADLAQGSERRIRDLILAQDQRRELGELRWTIEPLARPMAMNQAGAARWGRWRR